MDVTTDVTMTEFDWAGHDEIVERSARVMAETYWPGSTDREVQAIPIDPNWAASMRAAFRAGGVVPAGYHAAVNAMEERDKLKAENERLRKVAEAAQAVVDAEDVYVSRANQGRVFMGDIWEATARLREALKGDCHE